MTDRRELAFDFNDLFIFEVSKNHAGDVAHGMRLVREFSRVAKEAGVRGSIKLQFQDLDTYIHPSQRQSDSPRMKRYFASRLSEAEFGRIVDTIHAEGLISMSTPFDEPSVDMLDRLGVEVIKLASSSANDWPLIERVIRSRKPVVCSTGGLSFAQIDPVHDLLKERGIPFSFLHCVSIYPTPREHMQLHEIRLLSDRYKGVPIGFSTHESSDELGAVQLAYALGARLFEKHVAIPTEDLERNPFFQKIRAYTATPEQVRAWLGAYRSAVLMIGNAGSKQYLPEPNEVEALRTMTRGVFAKRALSKGTVLRAADVYFAIPLGDGQLSAGEWREGCVADRRYDLDEALSAGLAPKAT